MWVNMVNIINNFDKKNDNEEDKDITYKIRLFNNLQAKILLKLFPSMGEEMPRLTLDYLSRMVGINFAYLQKQIDFLLEKGLVSFEEEQYFLSNDNLFVIQQVLEGQSMIILSNKIKSFLGDV